MGQITNFKLRALEEKLNEVEVSLKKNDHKTQKAAYIGMISEIMSFFKSEYPDLNREPLKKLLTDILQGKVLNPEKLSEHNSDSKKQELNISRKRRTDSLIVAAIDLLIGDGVSEHNAIQMAIEILQKKNKLELLKLLKTYRSNLLPPHIKDLVQTLKLEGKKRFSGKQSAIIYLERASQNLK